MKQVLENEKHGNIVYEESFWTGKKSITINDVPLTKKSKNEFETQDGKAIKVVGGFFQGACLNIDGESIRVTPKIKWYEIVLAVIPFVLIMIWGNSVALCKIVPVVGGAIGGFISALFSCCGLFLMKSSNKIWLKILIGLAAIAVTFLVCFGIGAAIVGALT